MNKPFTRNKKLYFPKGKLRIGFLKDLAHFATNANEVFTVCHQNEDSKTVLALRETDGSFEYFQADRPVTQLIVL